MSDNRKTKFLAIGMLMLVLNGCATGNELHGKWVLTVGRSGTCRVIEHQANTNQLTTSTVWRGEGCGSSDSLDQGSTSPLYVAEEALPRAHD